MNSTSSKHPPAALLRALAAMIIGLTTVSAVAEPADGQGGGQIDPTTLVSEQPIRSWQVRDLQPPAQSSMPDWDVLVWDFAELNGVMYVGGRFRKVRQYSGATEHDQPFLAAFDVATGQWISSFRPDLDDGVYALAASPDGSRLLVGGEFTSVDGAPLTSGFAALDPFTGDPDPNWKASVTREDDEVLVKEIVVSGGHIYIGGRFSHVQGQNQGPTRRYSLARLNGDGTLDNGWSVPVNGGKIMSMAASPDRSELYLGGFFTTVGETAGTKWMSMIRTTDGMVVPLTDPIPPDRKQYVFGLDVTDDLVFAGTEQHRLKVWDRQALTLEHEWFSNGHGGDYQAVLATPKAVWSGGHHHGWEKDREGATDLRSQVQWLTAYDGRSGDRVDGWIARLGMRDGVFALAEDSEGKLWVGGDPSSAGTIPTGGFAVFPLRTADDEVNLARGGTATQSSTGETNITFKNRPVEIRCNDAQNTLVGPPEAAVDGKIGAGRAECSLTATEAETNPWWQVDLGAVGEIDMIRLWNMYSDGRPQDLSDPWIAIADTAAAVDSTDPVALAADPDVTLLQIPGQVPWFHELPVGVFGRHVRVFLNNAQPVQLRIPEIEVIDLSDVTPPPPIDTDAVLVPAGADWRYLDDGSDPGPNWNEPGFDDLAWPRGPALLGFGDDDIATVTTAGVTTTYLRHRFPVGDPASIAGLSLGILADDGAVAHLNGVELHRLRMPAGAIGHSTRASDTVWGAAERAWTNIEVPAAALVAGENVLAVELHNNWSGGGDLAGDATLTVIDDVIAPPPVDQELLAFDHSWRYLDTGVEPPAQWRDSGFDDGAWASGPAQLGYGDGDEATTVAEGPVPDRHITTWFRTEFELADPSDVDHLDLSLIRDDGAVVHLNGVEVVRTNLPDGPIDGTTLASDYAWGPGETEPQLHTVPAVHLVPGTNTVAVEIHSASPGSRDLSFALELIGVAP